MKGARVWRSARSAIGVFDAGVSSLGNLAVGVAAARTLPLASFSLVSLTMLAGALLVGVVRNVWGDPLVLTHAAAPNDERRAAARRALGSCRRTLTFVSLLVGGILWAILRASGGDAGDVLGLAAAFALVCILLGTQDLARQAAYCLGKPTMALLNSATWTGCLLIGLAVLRSRPDPWTPAALILLWGATTIPGAAVAMLRLRVWPRLHDGGGWLGAHRRIIRNLLFDFGLTQLTAEGSMLLISVIAGATEAGLIRKAQLPLAPLVVMTSGVVAVAQPALVRRIDAGSGRPEVARLVYRMGAFALVLALLAGFLVWATPTRVVEIIAGEQWNSARPLVLSLAGYLGLGAVAAFQGVALRAFGQVGRQVRMRVLFSPILLALVGLGAYFGAVSAAWALTAAVALIVVVWAHLLRTACPATARDGSPATAVPGPTATVSAPPEPVEEAPRP